MTEIKRTLIINTDPSTSPQGFLRQLNSALQQVMESVDQLYGLRGSPSVAATIYRDRLTMSTEGISIVDNTNTIIHQFQVSEKE